MLPIILRAAAREDIAELIRKREKPAFMENTASFSFTACREPKSWQKGVESLESLPTVAKLTILPELLSGKSTRFGGFVCHLLF